MKESLPRGQDVGFLVQGFGLGVEGPGVEGLEGRFRGWELGV